VARQVRVQGSEPVVNYFDERWYLLNNPDIRDAIKRGEVKSALDHYNKFGKAEGRLPGDPQLLTRAAEVDRLLLTRQYCFDQLLVTNDGTALILGWIDDRSDPIGSLTFTPYVEGSLSLEGRIIRYKRDDISQMKGDKQGFDYGVWIIFDGLQDRLPHLGGSTRIDFVSGRVSVANLPATVVSAEDLRGMILDALTWPKHRRSSPADLGKIVGPILRHLSSTALGRASISAPVVHGIRKTSPRLSVIICVFRRIDLMLRQAALFADVQGVNEIEFIYINNSPELASSFHSMAETAHELYGLNVVSITASENIGFAKANNEAARLAKGKTLLFLNPDVIPGDRDCIIRAFHVADEMGERSVVGALLLYDDDSIQHFGLCFKLADRENGLWRNEHLLKGLPGASIERERPVSVEAVTAAVMLVRKTFFLSLEGFDERYIFGDYEDSDFCLRARQRGGKIVVDPRLLFYHLEGQGAPRQIRESAASMMNRILFSELWDETIQRLASSAPNRA
jgi:O-antigen biosynthesis protein